MRTQPFPDPNLWNDGEVYYDTVLEAQLQASIEEEHQKQKARLSSPPPKEANEAALFQDIQPVQSIDSRNSIASIPLADSTFSQLVSGCGIAAIDGYIAMRDYAVSRGFSLAQAKADGIDLQDVLSTLVIHRQKMAEMEQRPGNQARRWR